MYTLLFCIDQHAIHISTSESCQVCLNVSTHEALSTHIGILMDVLRLLSKCKILLLVTVLNDISSLLLASLTGSWCRWYC